MGRNSTGSGSNPPHSTSTKKALRQFERSLPPADMLRAIEGLQRASKKVTDPAAAARVKAFAAGLMLEYRHAERLAEIVRVPTKK